MTLFKASLALSVVYKHKEKKETAYVISFTFKLAVSSSFVYDLNSGQLSVRCSNLNVTMGINENRFYYV